VNSGLSTKHIKELSVNEVMGDRAVWVLESHNEEQCNSCGVIGGWGFNLRRHLYNLQGSIGGVVLSERGM